jgi:LCP family protein required for cell wall assembly
VKRQFVQIRPSKSDSSPIKAPSSTERSPADTSAPPSHKAPLASSSQSGLDKEQWLGDWQYEGIDAVDTQQQMRIANTPAPTHRAAQQIEEQDTNVQPSFGLSPSSSAYAEPSISAIQTVTSVPAVKPQQDYPHVPVSPPVYQPMSDPAIQQEASWPGIPQAPIAQSTPAASYQQGGPAYPYWAQPAQSFQPPQPPASYAGKTKQKKRRSPVLARVAIATLLVIVIAAGTGTWYYQTNFASHFNRITGQQAANLTGKKTNSSSQSQVGVSNSASIGNKRINILLLGSDNDAKFQGGAPLAQTDIIVTIDPTTKYVGMLSIPRDMRVNIPDGIAAPNKLDTAFAYGWQYVHVGPTAFSNAVGLSMLTIEQNYGIHIDHYAWVGLDGFIKVIDTAGGLDIDATHPMVDDDYPNDVNNKNAYDYKRLYIAPGPQHMNGVQALEYVRTRHSDLVGDFGRSARQQQVISQLKTKLDTPDIINKINELAADLDGYVKTDMQLPDLVNFMNYARSLDLNKVDRVVLSPPYSSMARDNSGDYLPNCALILPKIAQMFDLGNNANCAPVNATRKVGIINPVGPATATSESKIAQIQAQDMPLQPLSQMAQVSTMSLSSGNKDPLGMRSLLDLTFIIAFDSLDGSKV